MFALMRKVLISNNLPNQGEGLISIRICRVHRVYRHQIRLSSDEVKYAIKSFRQLIHVSGRRRSWLAIDSDVDGVGDHILKKSKKRR